MLYPWDQIHLHLRPTNREVPTLKPIIDAMKTNGEWCGGRQDIIMLYDILRGRVVVAIDRYILMTEYGNVSLHHSDPTTALREDGQGSLLIFLVPEPVYTLF